ncbi:hypothetical protein C0Q70_14983 [Pomacea canaliculata]|uniref:Uncharacterized protein n=1 Tax=Pomacea canaliculata TaxID=400727 RepID=A0A2T7NTJ4_POMCA|nr:hypothetical protein C0Q70_14983 [Pomacea canaliculata]
MFEWRKIIHCGVLAGRAGANRSPRVLTEDKSQSNAGCLLFGDQRHNLPQPPSYTSSTGLRLLLVPAEHQTAPPPQRTPTPVTTPAPPLGSRTTVLRKSVSWDRIHEPGKYNLSEAATGHQQTLQTSEGIGSFLAMYKEMSLRGSFAVTSVPGGRQWR